MRGLLGILAALSFVASACGSDGDSDIAGRSLVQFVGRIDQVGTQFTFYGYARHVDGIDDSALFTDAANRNETTARLTIHAPARMTGRSNIENIFVLDVSGDVSFYAKDTGGARFSDPASFAGGTKIATTATTFHNTITVIAPNQGISQGSGEVGFNDRSTVSLGGKTYTFAPKDTKARIEMVGSGTRLEPVEPRANFIVSGEIIVIQ